MPGWIIQGRLSFPNSPPPIFFIFGYKLILLGKLKDVTASYYMKNMIYRCEAAFSILKAVVIQYERDLKF